MHQPLRLTAMTLRGVGSYVHGQRIEFRPVTILCGKNGSGKSTWFKVLNLLHSSYAAGCLPFGFSWGSAAPDEHTNAFLRWAADEDSTILHDKLADDEYGKLGTIGLEFIADDDIDFGAFEVPAVVPTAGDNLARQFLMRGACPKGTKIRLRIAHLDVLLFDDVARHVEHSFELCLNGRYCLVAKKPHDHSQRARVDGEWESPSHYDFSCSPAFLGESDLAAESRIPIARVSDPASAGQELQIWRLENAQRGAEHVCQAALRRIDGVLSHFFSGFFYVSAFRVPVCGSISDGVEKNDKPRHVGSRAEAAFEMERTYAYNRLAVTGAYTADRKWLAPNHPSLREPLGTRPFVFESWVSAWLEHLVETRITLHYPDATGESLSDPWTHAGLLPTAVLEADEPASVEELDELDEDRYVPDRFMHVCFGNDDSYSKTLHPIRLSTGFHQVFPIIVQAGLMSPNETMAIENPEAHLHPSLQLQVAEFLLTEALQGKLILIETHSDLIVYRFLRAILEEEIPQEQLRLYFTSLAEHEAGYRASNIARLEAGALGEISNWPEGFMDDSVREARRLFRTMYGGSSQDEGR